MKKHIIKLVAPALVAMLLLAGCATPPQAEPAAESAQAAPEETVAQQAAEPESTTEAEPVAKAGPRLEDILSKVDENYAFGLISEMSFIGNDGNEMGFKNAGSTGEAKTRDRIVQEMEAIGLEVSVDNFPVDAWEFKSASLETDGGAITLSAFAGSPGTEAEGITAEIVDVGDGTAKNYEGLDVEGKIALAHFDNYNYWFMAPAYQAELAGAKAIIVETIGDNYNVGNDTLYCFDVASRDAIPVLNITKNDSAALMERMAAGPVTGTLKVDATLNKGGGQSGNVLGMIKGKNGTDQNITMGAHYDGYFHAFMDDLFGVGVLISIAKAMIESGYQPEHNIIFVAFGAEEYGAASNHYDWCTGVWNQINKVTPEWVGNTLVHLEVDSVRPDANTYIINSTQEFFSFFNEKMPGIAPPADPYVNGAALKGQNGPWSQDYDMIIAGVPGLCAGKTGDSEWKTYAYHTNASSPEEDWNPTVYNYIVEQYTSMLLDFDQCVISPLDFSVIADEIEATLDPNLVTDKDALGTYQDTLSQVKQLGGGQYALVQEANGVMAELSASGVEGADDARTSLTANNKEMLDAYKIVQKDVMKLDIWDVVAYKHDILQLNINSLNEAIAALEAGDADTALGSMFNVDTTYLAADFSKEVYEYTGIDSLDPTRDDLYWGTGKTMPQINTYDVFHSISGKAGDANADFKDDIATLQSMLETENQMLNDAVKEDTGHLQSVVDILENSTLAENLDSAKALLG